MHLVNMRIVTLVGVVSKRILFHISTEIPMARTVLVWNLEIHLNLFNEYCTDAFAEKLAPVTNSQRNEALNSVVGSKNPKIRFYGGSESDDFRVACGVAQTNLRYGYINRTLEALNIDPGMFCYKLNEQMTKRVNQDKIRKSTVEFKCRRSQIHANNCSQTARKEAREVTTFETGVGINRNLDAHTSDSVTDTIANVLTMSDTKFRALFRNIHLNLSQNKLILMRADIVSSQYLILKSIVVGKLLKSTNLQQLTYLVPTLLQSTLHQSMILTFILQKLTNLK